MELLNPRGMSDCAPEEMILKQEIIDRIRRVFEIYGYSPLDTPLIERYEVLAAKFAAGEESDAMKEMFTLTDQGGRKLGLRFDLTLPFARFIGMNPNLKMPFKRYQIGKVYRDGPVSMNRFREFTQCDVDIAGTFSMLAETELMLLTINVFKALGIDVSIEINNRKLMFGLFDYSGIPKNKYQSVAISVDKIDKQGIDAVKKELKQKGISDDSIKKLAAFFGKKGDLTFLKGMQKFLNSDEGKQGFEELKQVLANVNTKKIIYNPMLARGLGYYTGTVYEVLMRSKDAIAAGGRYDKLIGSYIGSKEDIPAVGISFGIERIMNIIKETRKEKRTVSKVYVIPINTAKKSLAIVQKLRAQNIPVSIPLTDRGISKNLNYANTKKIPYVIFVGEKELKEKKVKLRNMETGKEQLLSLADVIKRLKKA
ncbi:MAG: histidine--tRNA ligase [archaeon]